MASQSRFRQLLPHFHIHSKTACRGVDQTTAFTCTDKRGGNRLLAPTLLPLRFTPPRHAVHTPFSPRICALQHR